MRQATSGRPPALPSGSLLCFDCAYANGRARVCAVQSWRSWTRFIGGREQVALGLLEHVYRESLARLVFRAWRASAVDARRTREYFEVRRLLLSSAHLLSPFFSTHSHAHADSDSTLNARHRTTSPTRPEGSVSFPDPSVRIARVTPTNYFQQPIAI